MIYELFYAAVAVFVGFLTIGFQIYKMTQEFDEQYLDKVKAICDIFDGKIKADIDELIKKRSEVVEDRIKQIFPEAKADSLYQQISNIRIDAEKYDYWNSMIEDGKKYLRDAANNIFFCGSLSTVICLILSFSNIFKSEDSTISNYNIGLIIITIFLVYFSFISLISSYRNFRKCRKIESEIDNAYTKVMKKDYQAILGWDMGESDED